MKNFTTITTVFLFAFASLFAQVDLDNGLVASYPFNGDATDASGNGNDGVVTAGYAGWGEGTPVLTTDRNGAADAAYYFDGGGNIEIPYSTLLNPGQITLSWWIYMEERPNNDYMISMKGWECYKVNLQTENKVFGTVMSEDPVTPGSFVVKDRDHSGDGLVAEQWYHLAVSFGGGHMKFYIDGVMVKDFDEGPTGNIIDISADPHNLVFGQNKPTSEFTGVEGTTGEFFKGKMDDFRIYNRVLADDEVLALFELADTEVDLEEGLVASYPFNGDATDASGNGNDGVVTVGYADWGGGTPVLTTDRNDVADAAYYFDGGGNIEIPYSTLLNPAQITLSWWIYMEERPNNDYMISMKGWECYKVNLQTENKVFGTVMAEDPANPGSFVVKDADHSGDGLVAEQWYHLAVSFGGGHMKFYIDGVMVKDFDDVSTGNIIDISADPHNLVFGQNKPTSEFTGVEGTTGEFFKGKMDDFMIYNRVLSDDEVLALFEIVVSARAPEALNASFDSFKTYPNPFSSTTTIEFNQKERGMAILTVHNAVGQEVASILSQEQMPGSYQFIWDASHLTDGIYFCRLSVGGVEKTHKLFLTK